MAQKNWRPVPGFPEVEVSDCLSVRAVPRTLTYERSGFSVTQHLDAHELRVVPQSNGYPSVWISTRRRYVGLHVLVCAAFHGMAPNGHMALHRDGVPLNCTPANLYWGTAKDNAADSIKHGTMRRGEGHGKSKLSTADVLKIKASTETHASLARDMGVAYQTIRSVRNGRTWGHVQGKN